MNARGTLRIDSDTWHAWRRIAPERADALYDWLRSRIEHDDVILDAELAEGHVTITAWNRVTRRIDDGELVTHEIRIHDQPPCWITPAEHAQLQETP